MSRIKSVSYLGPSQQVYGRREAKAFTLPVWTCVAQKRGVGKDEGADTKECQRRLTPRLLSRAKSMWNPQDP